MISFERRTGRLIEVRMESGFSLAHAQQALNDFRGLMGSTPGPVVLACNLLGADILSQESFALMGQLFRADNAKIERSAILLNENFLFGKQMERLVREAGNPNRRTFRTAPELRAWVAEVLTTDELASLDQLLS